MVRSAPPRRQTPTRCVRSDQAECPHGFGHAHETSDICPEHIIPGRAAVLGGAVATVVDTGHDLRQAGICPVKAQPITAGIFCAPPGWRDSRSQRQQRFARTRAAWPVPGSLQYCTMNSKR